MRASERQRTESADWTRVAAGLSCLFAASVAFLLLAPASPSRVDDDATIRSDAVYVWPQRVPSEGEVPSDGHYRERRDAVWHPHPVYRLVEQDGDVWGTVELGPADDDWLVTDDTEVHVIDEGANVTYSKRLPTDWRPLKGCFYRGRVTDHRGPSMAVLSLCHGLTGHLRTSRGSFFIEPAPETRRGESTGRPVRHVIYRAAGRFDGPLESGEESPGEERRGDASARRRRVRRSMSQERFVEILVVADGKMVAYHGDNLQHYILTLMSVVSMIYKDASLGNPVHIAVVRVMMLRDYEFVLASGDEPANGRETYEFVEHRPGKSASEMLRNFCKWQRVHNDPDDRSSMHHDTALLLTRENICRNPQMQKCDTLGLAELGTMCDPSNSCSIVQDNGLSAAFTIAHELGHVLNMPHDDDFKCQQFAESTGSVHNVMSRMLDHNTFPWAWSNCSRYFITEFLDGGYGDCLDDRPASDLLDGQRAAKRLPGENFDENKQCELVFGAGSKICPYMPPCKRLWCTTAGGEQEGCRTQHMPWADGTPCGRGRWCRHGSCVSRDAKTLEPVDGQWGPWQEWGTCSRTCGGGVQKSTRNCDNPPPANGGTYCIGKRIRYRSCNTPDCPAGAPDFREKQCADFNSNNFNIQGLPADVRWVPKYAGINVKDRCRLYCRVEQSSAYYLLKDKVIDGTSCGPDTDDICVNGICKQASCNHILGRKEQLDMCGVCGGDNSTCVVVNGSFNASVYGYNHVARIPAGSSSLDIRQRGFQGSNRDDNYLALYDPATGEYLLNGNFVVSMFQKSIQFGGTTIEYTGSDAVVERLNSSKPLKKDIEVQVLSVGNLYSPDIWYQYVVSKAEGRAPMYQWRLQEQWSPCNRLCQGQQFRKPICVQVTPGSHQKMPEDYCSAQAPPPVETQPCQTQCVLRWRVVHHSECSAHCGQGVRNLTKQCEQESLAGSNPISIPVDDRHCRHLTDVPPEQEPCIGTCHSAHWQFHPWSQCSVTCGGGYQTRKAHCVDLNGRPIPEVHCPADEKVTRQNCHMETCPRWEVGEWTPCSVSCGIGERQRGYWCQVESYVVAKSYCYPVRPPVHKEACRMPDCPQWHASPWGQCSVSCGAGEAMRVVGCRMDNGTVVDAAHCAGQEKPASVQQCVEPPCPTEPPTTTTTTPPTTSTTSTVASTEPSLTSESPTTSAPSTTSSPVAAPLVALAGFRPQAIEIHMDPTLNNLDTIWEDSNDVPRIVANWRTGVWGQCSTSCDGGIRLRSVVCYDLVGSREVSASHCPGPAPESYEQCNAQPCTAWVTHNWTACSVTCGRGVSLRMVECQYSFNSSRAPEELCDSTGKPASEKSCIGPVALCGGSHIPHSVSVEHNHTAKIPQWRTGSWGSCSKTCGGGYKRRQVVCHDENLKESDGCNPAKRPQDTVHCNTDPCPTWSTGDWAHCSQTCGGGTQTRPVTCQDHLGIVVPDHRCHHAGRPEYSQNCRTEPCPTAAPIPEKTYKWKTATWTTCSKTCGKGEQFREVYCYEVEGRSRVSEELCPAPLKPKSRRGCNKAACPYSWQTDDWSDCSHPCGNGIQLRRVACHRINAYEWVDPEPVSFGCNATQRPKETQPCNLGDCHALYSWRTSAWQACASSKCGRQGFQKRALACVSRSGARVSRSFCPQEFRPIRKRKCKPQPCGYTSCRDVQMRMETKTGAHPDDHYTIVVAGKNITIYCHLMNTSSPVEYLTLASGPQDNYAEVYEKMLIRPDHCPHQGARKDSCECYNNRRSAGTTVFTKIRLNITSLRVDSHDYTFARMVRGQQWVGYGEAGDCYSTANCPQGRFSINLQGTGLRVSPHTSWAGHGHRASLWINRLEDNQKIQGKCGGYCGRCSPDPHAGLKLDVV